MHSIYFNKRNSAHLLGAEVLGRGWLDAPHPQWHWFPTHLAALDPARKTGHTGSSPSIGQHNLTHKMQVIKLSETSSIQKEIHSNRNFVTNAVLEFVKRHKQKLVLLSIRLNKQLPRVGNKNKLKLVKAWKWKSSWMSSRISNEFYLRRGKLKTSRSLPQSWMWAQSYPSQHEQRQGEQKGPEKDAFRFQLPIIYHCVYYKVDYKVLHMPLLYIHP